MKPRKDKNISCVPAFLIRKEILGFLVSKFKSGLIGEAVRKKRLPLRLENETEQKRREG